MAQHLAMSGELSQEQILELIDAQKRSGSGSGSKRLEDDSDEDILEPSTQARSSNRRGGGSGGGGLKLSGTILGPSRPGVGQVQLLLKWRLN